MTESPYRDVYLPPRFIRFGDLIVDANRIVMVIQEAHNRKPLVTIDGAGKFYVDASMDDIMRWLHN